MDFAPSTIIQIFSGIRCDINHNDVYLFKTITEEEEFFQNRVQFTLTDFSYQRLNKRIRVEINAERLYKCNYLRFQNENFSDKWIYAFITDIEFAGNNVSFIYFTIDHYMTWKNDVTFYESFVEREHVEDDTPGKHLYPEGIETGKFKVNYHEFTGYLDNMAILVGYSYKSEQTQINVNGAIGAENISYVIPSIIKKYAGGTLLSGTYSGSQYIAWDIADYKEVNSFLTDLMKDGQIDMITSISMCPQEFINGFTSGKEVIQNSNSSRTVSFPISSGNKWETFGNLDGYIPRNKKLLTGEFNFCAVNNMNGTETELYFEKWNSPICLFNLKGYVGSNPSCRLVPSDYNINRISGVPTQDNYDYSIPLSGWPLCSFSYSAYANELGANRMSIAQSTVNEGISSVWDIFGSLLTGNVKGALDSVLGIGEKVTNSLAKMGDSARIPNTVKGNQNLSNLNIAERIQDFLLMQKCVTREYAERIDRYFDMYGYRVNVRKSLNFYSRPYWNYIKTLDAKIYGNVPNEALQEMKNMLNHGCTFWHTGELGNYDKNNGVV